LSWLAKILRTKKDIFTNSTKAAQTCLKDRIKKVLITSTNENEQIYSLIKEIAQKIGLDANKIMKEREKIEELEKVDENIEKQT
jgi:hypothetical protein